MSIALSQDPSVVHHSRRDAWQTVPGLALTAVLAWFAVAAMRSGTVLRGVGGLVLLVAALLVGWSVASLSYQITDREILARSGPRLWRVPLEGIVRIYPARGLSWGPAGSLDLLHIDYLCHGKPDHLLLSPEDKFAFLADLALLCPWLDVDGDRAERRLARPT
jgi:hypothetical protein